MRVSPALRMQASRMLRSGQAPDPKHGIFIGGWGNLGSQTQKGVVSYTISANRQRPMAGALHSAVFNTARRTREQLLFWLTPMVAGYAIMEWAIEKNEYLNSKPGRLEFAESEE